MGFCIVYFANRRNLQKNILYICIIQKNVVSLHHLLEITKVPTVKTLLLRMTKATAYQPSTFGMATSGNAYGDECAI